MAALVVLASSLTACSTDNPSATALVACKQQVKAQLANPETVDFATTSMSITESDTGIQITGHLTAETGFGVKKGLTFTCTADPTGSITDAQVTND